MKIKNYHILKHYDICKNIFKNKEKSFSIVLNLYTHYHGEFTP